KNAALMYEFNATTARTIEEHRGYVIYLKAYKLPQASEQYALGREKYMKLVEYGEMVTLSPEQLLDLGMRELQRKQQVFAETARQIDPNKKAIEVFQAIKTE